jgi:hypothetical protein
MLNDSVGCRSIGEGTSIAFTHGTGPTKRITSEMRHKDVRKNVKPNLSITKMLKGGGSLYEHFPTDGLGTYTWKACCMTIGFLHRKRCPSLDTYPRPAGALFGLLGGWNIGRVQYDGWPEPPPPAECSGPGHIGAVRVHLEKLKDRNFTPTHGITAISELDSKG